MKKDLIERFIKKYRLNGNINAAVWVLNKQTLQVKAMSSDRKLYAAVTLKQLAGYADVQIGVGDSGKLLNLLKAMPEDISLDVLRYSSGDAAVVQFSASTIRAEYVADNPAAMDPIPKIKKLPAFNAAIQLDDGFTNWLFRACTVIHDKHSVLTLEVSQETGKLEVALGRCDRFTFQPATVDNKDTVTAPLSFSANALKGVLKANPEIKDPILMVADAGVASIAFSGDDLDSEYYFVKIDTED